MRRTVEGISRNEWVVRNRPSVETLRIDLPKFKAKFYISKMLVRIYTYTKKRCGFGFVDDELGVEKETYFVRTFSGKIEYSHLQVHPYLGSL